MIENKEETLKFTELEQNLRNYAKENKVPIILDEGLVFLENIIKKHQPKHILEIGTAIGYSAIRMANVCGSEVTTIERNNIMIKSAKESIKKAGLEKQIHLIESDALDAISYVNNESFDLIFIDAAKAQYEKFFKIYTPLLSPKGIVVCDNMSFHGLTIDLDLYEKQSRSVRGLIRKLNRFKEYLLNLENYETTIYEIGDGMAVSIKKE